MQRGCCAGVERTAARGGLAGDPRAGVGAWEPKKLQTAEKGNFYTASLLEKSCTERC